MDWIAVIGAITGVTALLGLAFAFGKYAARIDDYWRIKDDLSATIVKVDTLWKVYVEDTLIGHSNPGGGAMLPEELKNEIRTLLDNDSYLQKVKEPTLLVVDKIGLEKFSDVARSNKMPLRQVLFEVNVYIFEECLRK